MATKTISLEIDAYEKLKRAKRDGESFSAVVRRTSFGPQDSKGATILSVLAARAVRQPDLEATGHWESSGLPERTASPSAFAKRNKQP